MKKTVYVTDLDGTLLNSDSIVSPCSIEIINTLVDSGMLFTYATARSLNSASQVTKGLTTNLPVIIYNGTFIIDPVTREILHANEFTKEQVKDVQILMKKHKIFPLVYAYIKEVESVTYLDSKIHQGMKHYLLKRKGDPRFKPVKSEDNLYNGNVFYFTCIGDKERLEPIYQEIKDNKAFNSIFHQEIYRQEYWLEIMPKKATKANAIKKLKELLTIDEIVSFGDAINDLPMFSISERCYAVENAVQVVKENATEVIEGNDHDGVAKWLKKHVEL